MYRLAAALILGACLLAVHLQPTEGSSPYRGPRPARSQCGVTTDPSVAPIGGGLGYELAVAREDATSVVHDRAGFLAALSDAPRGSVIYVDDNAEVDLTGLRSIEVPAGVTIASGRGVHGSRGGLLITSEIDTRPLFKVMGADVRFTGLRLRGPDPEMRDARYQLPTSRGISVKGHDRLEVDNCDISGFSHAAIYLRSSRDAHVHHNFIHHNQRRGLGYGVSVGVESTALVEANLFDYNRHAVAGTGHPGASYEARYNLIGPHANGHGFDMHGEDEREHNGSPRAGDWIYIHHNTFLQLSVNSVVIRGRPEVGALVEYNSFAAPDPRKAVRQRLFFGNLWVALNCYGIRWHAAVDPDDGSWLPLAPALGDTQAAVGDFDGDGRDDLFRADGERWWIAPGGGPYWEPAAWSRVPLDALTFADVDADGVTDVLRRDGPRWWVSRSGLGEWRDLERFGDAPPPPSSSADAVLFGDFDGDGRLQRLR